MTSRIQRRAELVFVVLGSLAAVIYVCLSVPGVLARNQQVSQAVNSDADVIPPDTLASSYMRHSRDLVEASVIGTLSIPELRLDAPIVEGVSNSDLRRGVGHVPGSALSGGLGNMVLAAHRDAIFRPLRSIRPGMLVKVHGTDGTYTYQVDSSRIVSPDRVDVMDIESKPEVTLITCYPFNYVGSAPMRFVVKAHLVSALPE